MENKVMSSKLVYVEKKSEVKKVRESTVECTCEGLKVDQWKNNAKHIEGTCLTFNWKVTCLLQFGPHPNMPVNWMDKLFVL